MVELEYKDFDLAKIAKSGQCFRLLQTDERHFVLNAFSCVLELSLETEHIKLNCTSDTFNERWKQYFDLDADYSAFYDAIDKNDAFLCAAMDYGRGIRILRQEPWETLVSFIISQRKSVPAIRTCVEALCRQYGNKITAKDETYYAFPSAKRLASLSCEELNTCALGYRSKYIKQAAQMVESGEIDLCALDALNDEALEQALMTIPGVGLKVANCVMLFAYHRLSGFPRDVWINRILEHEYHDEFPVERYRGFEGVIQQYMFYYARENKLYGKQKG